LKRILSCLFFLCLLLPGLSSVESADHRYADARGTADFMQKAVRPVFGEIY